MQGEAIGEVAIAGLARRIEMHPARRIAPAEREQRVAVAGDPRTVTPRAEPRRSRA